MTVPTFTRSPRIVAVGLTDWDRLMVTDGLPASGECAIVTEELDAPGGTTSNSAVAASRLGATVAIAALVGDDAEGAALRAGLTAEGVNCDWLTTVPDGRSNLSTVIVTPGGERTLLWRKGVHLVRGDRLDIAAVFGHDVVLLDIDDAPLRRFLTDLPAHTAPLARLLGTMTYLAGEGEPDTFEVAMRHDALVGNEREAMTLTGAPSLDDALTMIQKAMPGSNLRAAIVTRGAAGAVAVTRDERWDVPGFPVDTVDTTGAGDAFAGALSCAFALRWPWPEAVRFANAAAALSTRRLGAQTGLPSFAEVQELLARQP